MIYTDGDGADFERVYAEALKYLGLPDDFEVEAIFCDEEEIRDCNRERRGADSVTDVLSFPSVDFRFPYKKSDYKQDIDPETDRLLLGEIIICTERMRAQSVEYGHSERRETCYLFLHGLLHLFGFDHIDGGDRAEMREAEEGVLGALGIAREDV